MPIRIFELAQELGVFPEFLVDDARALTGREFTDPFAIIDDRTANDLRRRLIQQRPANAAITSFGVGNFKAFGDPSQDAPLAPITLVFGANSSGKSSLLHALLFAHHARQTGELDAAHPVLGGNIVDLGHFGQMMHRHAQERQMTLSFTFAPFDLVPSIGYRESCTATVFLRAPTTVDDSAIGQIRESAEKNQYTQKPRIAGVRIETDDGEVMHLSPRADGTFRCDRADFNHPLLEELLKQLALAATFRSQIGEDDLSEMKSLANQVLHAIRFSDGTLIPESASYDDQASDTSAAKPSRPTLEAADWKSAVESGLPTALQQLLRGITERLATYCASLVYLAPLRSYPDRWFALVDSRDPNWQAGGGSAWDTLVRDDAVRTRVNAWFASTAKSLGESAPQYEFRVNTMLPSIQVDAVIERETANYLMEKYEAHEQKRGSREDSDQEGFYFPFDALQADEIAKRIHDTLRAATRGLSRDTLVMVDRRNNARVSQRDVGVGISQSVPVLVHAFASEGKTLLMEQPEIHLHPSMQAELGDVFIDSALGPAGNRFVIETHSEHLILRLLRRIRQCGEHDNDYPVTLPRIRPEDVSVLYVAPGKDGSTLKRMRITSDGDFADAWPGGFFMERGKELF